MSPSFPLGPTMESGWANSGRCLCGFECPLFHAANTNSRQSAFHPERGGARSSLGQRWPGGEKPWDIQNMIRPQREAAVERG
jgi:hypothetical protein